MATQADQQAIALALAYQRQTQAIRTQLIGFVTRLWRSLHDYRADQIRPFVDQVTPTVLGAQQHIANLTAGYLAHQRQLALGEHSLPVAIDRDLISGATVRNGTDPAEVYERPFHEVWRELARLPHEPGAVDQAIAAGLDYATGLAATDLQLAKRATSHQIISADRKATGYRRVLEGDYSCGLCIVASTRIYHKAELMPIHPGCDCGELTLYGHDPGLVIDPTTLEDVHQRIRDRFGISAADAHGIESKGLPDYKDVLVVHEHGELGPVLGVRGQDFTGPDGIRSAGHEFGPEPEHGDSGSGRPPTPPERAPAPSDEPTPDLINSPSVERIQVDKLGSLPPKSPPPDIDQMLEAHLIAPTDIDHRWQYFDQDRDRHDPDKEKRIAQWLRDHDVEVRSLDDRKGQGNRTPDAALLDLRRTLDFKTLRSQAATAIRNQIRYASTQSRTVIIDGRRAGISRLTAIEGLRRGLGLCGQQLDEVIIIVSDGTAVFWSRG